MNKLLPQQLMRGLEIAAAASKGSTPLEFAETYASPEYGFVPLRRSAKGRGFEPVPVAGGFHDAWALAAKSPREVNREAERWRKADAVGVTFPHGGPDWVLDPDTGKLTKFVIHMDGSLR